jgi:hypothetical protein
MTITNPVADVSLDLKLQPKPVQLVDLTGNYVNLTNGSKTVAIAAGTTADTVVKASAGTLARVLVTAVGTNTMLIYDNASGHTGTVIGIIPASSPVGTYTFQLPALNGITVQGNAANPAVTISFD